VIIKKIKAMHKRYGTTEGKKCKDCCNLIEHRYAKKYFKCTAYGTSSSISTDWAKKWQACGLFNKPVESDNRRAANIKVEEHIPMENQMTFWEAVEE
jgi:hypothetical protein